MSIINTRGPGAALPRKLRLGMVGGGDGAVIGAVHRIAARLDDCYEVVAGALSSNPERALASGTALRFGTTSVSGPGQKFRASASASAGHSFTQSRAIASDSPAPCMPPRCRTCSAPWRTRMAAP